jgi:predicted aspartyl protease/tetratricopeptide (TPR) repeat protein
MSSFSKWANIAFSALGALLAGLTFPLLAADPPKCKLALVVEWPVQLIGGLPVIEGAINGKKIGVLLDTGSFTTLITNAAAEKLELSTWPRSGYIAGFGGKSRVREVRIGELRIGGAVRKGISVLVGGERPIAGVDFILGDDFFKQLDMEFDYAKGIVRPFRPRDCEGVSLAYWDSKALELVMERGDKIVVPIKVNGQAARALVDSGASRSWVALSFAEKLGITPQTAGVVPAGCGYGIGAALVRHWVARFDTLDIAGETIRNPRLPFAEGPDDREFIVDHEVILGTDFLRAHRMLVSRTQHKVYFSYIGGLIFPTPPALDCDERLGEKSESEALAAYDHAIAENSSDTKALLHRAVLRARHDDANGALSDLDAVIRIEPGNAVALSLRSGVRAALKNYEGALADAGAAIANGMRTAQMYVTRARLRRAQGDYARAIEEYDEALMLDPRHQGALHGRGHHLFNASRFEAAENDFAALLAIRPSGFDSIWLSLSRSRRGLDGNAILEQGVAKLKDGQWPAPILQYLLGRLDGEALIAATANVDENKWKSQQCEARFYMAARLITVGQNSAARPLLEKARDECPRDYIEYDAALAELKKLQ